MAIFLTPVITDNEGEAAFAEFLKEILSDDYLCWYDVPIKSGRRKRQNFPDFTVFNPKFGFWILEEKEWSLDYILGHNPKEFTLTDRKAINPYEQASKQAFALSDLLKKERRFMEQGRLIIPVTYGAVLYNISRQEFEIPEKFRPFSMPGRLGNIPSQRVICSDELRGKSAENRFEERLLSMFAPFELDHEPFSEEEVSIIRDLIFPDIQIVAETAVRKLLTANVPRLLEPAQERVLRELKPETGTHVLFGVAGSGKTIILLNKARELLELEDEKKLSVLYLCRGTCVAKQIQQQAANLDLPAETIYSIHKWCGDILKKHEAPLPRSGTQYPAELIKQIKNGNIIPDKYDAILLDEGHDFREKPDWFQLVASVRKSHNSLFAIAYDEAQTIYGNERKNFPGSDLLSGETKFKKHILRKNFRNSEQILLFAKVLGDAFLIDSENEIIPKVRPIGHGKKGKLPLLLECSSLDEELQKITAEIKKALKWGRRKSDIAVLYHTYDYPQLKLFGAKILKYLTACGIPASDIEKEFSKDLVKVMSITKAKGLGFGMVCIVGVARTKFSAKDREHDETNKKKYLEEDIRYLYNAITRAIEVLVITYTKPEDGTASSRRILKLMTALSKVNASEPSINNATAGFRKHDFGT